MNAELTLTLTVDVAAAQEITEWDAVRRHCVVRHTGPVVGPAFVDGVKLSLRRFAHFRTTYPEGARS